MSLYLVRRGKYRVKELNCGLKQRKKLENKGFGVGSVIEKLHNSKQISKNLYLTEEGIVSLERRFASSVLVEKVEK